MRPPHLRIAAMHRVVTLAIPDVVAFDLSIPAQVFGHLTERHLYEFVVCAEHAGPVSSSTGFDIEAKFGLEALETADTVIVPGFLPLDDPPRAVLDALRQASERGARIASVCIGAFALAAAGLLDGRTATTHWEHAEELHVRFPAVRLRPDVLYVDEGQLLTSAGIAAGIDLCLHMYRNDHGAVAASAVARRMVAAVHRTGGQAQFMQRPMPDSGSPPRRDVRMGGRAHRAATHRRGLGRPRGYAPRTFARHFRDETGTPPLRWLSAQRLLEARRLLEATDFSIDEVARRCGLGSAANLRLHLARDASTTPSAYRNAFRRPPLTD